MGLLLRLSGRVRVGLGCAVPSIGLPMLGLTAAGMLAAFLRHPFLLPSAGLTHPAPSAACAALCRARRFGCGYEVVPAGPPTQFVVSKGTADLLVPLLPEGPMKQAPAAPPAKLAGGVEVAGDHLAPGERTASVLTYEAVKGSSH